VALDGAALQIDDDANVAVYGSAATPRAIFESRAGIPSDAVVGFRDQLEEATAIARATRNGGETAPAAPRAAPVTVTGSSETQPEPPPATAETQTQGFQPVEDGEIRSEPLESQPTTP
jgi:hypothetical protein